MDQAVSRRNDLPPRNVCMLLAYLRWHLGRRLPDQFQVTQDGVVLQFFPIKSSPVDTHALRAHLFGKAQHVDDKETPLAVGHSQPRARYGVLFQPNPERFETPLTYQ